MNLDEIRELIRLMKENGIAEIDVDSGGEHVRLKTEPAAGTGAQPSPQSVHVYGGGPLAVPMGMPVVPAPGAAGSELHAGHVPEPETPDHDPGVVITSPIVGIFYAAPSPDKPAFVEPGAKIDESTVLCIIEAMKVLNEIKAETTGTVREVMVTNGQSVEYGQPLFVIDPA